MSRLGKINIILAVLLAVQLVVYLAVPKGSATFKKLYEPIYSKIDGKDVWKIVIEDPKAKEKVVIKKTDKAWVLPDSYDYPADTSKVEEILSLLQTLRRGKIVGENASMYPSYGVSDARPRMHLTMYDKDGKVLVDLLVGKGTVRSTFVRKAKGKTVYEVSTSLASKLFTDASYYFKESSLKLPTPKERRRITLTYAGETLVFEKKTSKDGKGKEKSEWTLLPPTGEGTATGEATGVQYDQHKIDMFASSLNGITFSDVAGKVGSGDFGFDKPYITITVETEKGEKHTLKVGKKVPKPKDSTEKEGSLVRSDRYAVLDDGPYVVILKSYIYHDWEKKRSDFVKKEEKKESGSKATEDDSEAQKQAKPRAKDHGPKAKKPNPKAKKPNPKAGQAGQ